MKLIDKFIILDDDPFSNVLCGMVINNSLGGVDIETFTDPELALAFVQGAYMKIVKPTILFVDINMPTITGWEFIEQFEKFDEAVKKQIAVYMLSSSVDQRDIEKAKANKNIKGFISKPLESEMIRSIARIQASNN